MNFRSKHRYENRKLLKTQWCEQGIRNVTLNAPIAFNLLNYMTPYQNMGRLMKPLILCTYVAFRIDTTKYIRSTTKSHKACWVPVVITAQHYSNDVLANVMNISFDSSQDDGSTVAALQRIIRSHINYKERQITELGNPNGLKFFNISNN